MAIDKCKYKVVHISTNATTWHSSKTEAFRKASAIDGLVMVRQAPGVRYEFLCEYRYGRKK